MKETGKVQALKITLSAYVLVFAMKAAGHRLPLLGHPRGRGGTRE